jgi:hypothetical protein
LETTVEFVNGHAVRLHCRCGELSDHDSTVRPEARCSRCGKLWSWQGAEIDAELVRED